METLKKEQIMPYMSYRLKMCERITRFNKKTLEEYEMSYGEGEIFSYIGSKTPYVVWDNGRGKTQETFLDDFNSEKGYMLILHPLSDLTKPIQHNGEEFIPIIKIADMYLSPRKHILNGTIAESKYGQLWYENISNRFLEVENQFSTECPINIFKMYKKLYEWRFAVDIPSHLWIDVNTLEENPYK